MKILILTNTKNYEFIEDKWIGESFEKDGNQVTYVNTIKKADFKKYDIFIKRNCWDINQEHFVVGQDRNEPYEYELKNSKIKRVNFNGKFDGSGNKHYLATLFKAGYPVIPTIDSLTDLNLLPKTDKYLLKPHNGLDGFGIKKGSLKGISSQWNNDYVIQPKISFVSEVQFYFVGNEFQYALEFSPSKVPVYPEPTQYNFNEKELKNAQKFANLSKDYVGVQRIDFLKTTDGKLLMLEIEDSAPYLDLESVSEKQRKIFIEKYKQNVYDYFKKDNCLTNQ